ncbi:MAG: hypothetical protein M3P93_06525, partial [Actinomycetota bacterium]|nr:hypothetical protein [Actinomycetota bacterium]
MTRPPSSDADADLPGELLRRWTAALGTDPDVDAAGRGLLDRYAEPHRRYHDQTHLLEVLVRLEQMSEPVPPGAVLGAFFHDAVYRGAPDDEERSAVLAAEVLAGLGVAPEVVDEVARLVRVT